MKNNLYRIQTDLSQPPVSLLTALFGLLLVTAPLAACAGTAPGSPSAPTPNTSVAQLVPIATQAAGQPVRSGAPGGRGDMPAAVAKPSFPDLAYANVSASQKLDLYLPQGSGPFPVVVTVHGGGFMMGDKADAMGTAGTDQLLAEGYAVAAVNYRLSKEAKAPAQIKC